MGNWGELPEDLLVLIAKRITLFENFLSFSGVCRSWRFVAINDNFKGTEQIPWLMLSDKDKPDERQFVSLRKGGVIRTINLPEARGKRCLETLGWLVTISEDGDMNLLHPFTRAHINLPHVTTFRNYDWDRMENHHSFIRKAVLSSCPKESKDYVLVVIYRRWGGCLAFWRPGDKSWTNVEAGAASFRDIIFYKGLFYGVMGRGIFLAFDVWGPDPTLAWPLGRVPIKNSGLDVQYIVESARVVLIVVRLFRGVSLPIFSEEDPSIFGSKDESRVDYRTGGFKVFEVDLSKKNGECVEKTSLGNNVIFLGDNASVSVEASRFPGIKANCIYYTTDKFMQGGGGNDMGIYDMEDRSLRPCYVGESSCFICPPMWVNPSSF